MKLCGAGNRDDVGAAPRGDLERRGAHAARGARDENPVSGIERRLADEGVVGGEKRFGEAPRRDEVDAVGHVDEMFDGNHAVARLAATTHDGADAASEVVLVHRLTHRHDDPREFQAGHVDGPTGWGGIESAALEQVGGVDARPRSLDHDVVRSRLRIGAFDDFEAPIDHDDGDHGGSLPTAASLRYGHRYGHTMTIYDIPVRTLAGEPASLAPHRDRTVLIVNVASKCGLTPQYEGLEALHRQYADRGFSVVGFPCNQFMGQEPGSAEEIQEFCSTTYGVSFPLFEKIDVNGDDRHPIYAELVGVADADGHDGDVRWNFEKFLVSPDGSVQRFAPAVTPEDAALVDAIEAALG